jgi:predicted ferric reductase
MSPKLLRVIAPVLFALNAVIIIVSWARGGGAGIFTGTVGETLIALGDLAGLAAYYLVLWQLLLIGRVGWIERAWGHDRLSRIHHSVGLAAVLLIGIHPILMTLGYSAEAQTTLVGQFLIFLRSYHDVLNAFLAYLLFLGIVAISVTIVRSRLRYESWYFVHVFLYLAIILAFDHQFANGHDLAGGWMVWYWNVLFYGVLAMVAWSRFLRPLIAYYRYGFRVARLEQETANVMSVIIEGRGLDRLRARAGQFVIVRFLAKGFWWQAHPFSLSESPNGSHLRLTIKAVGDYTREIPKLPVGTRVILEGPLGRFTSDRASGGRIALIAGGIGITPLRSLFQEFSRQGRAVDLIYAARSDADFALKDELQSLENPTAHMHLMPEDRYGRLTPELIAGAVPDIASRFVYLCGPPPMMKAVRAQLLGLGVPDSAVLYEKFQLG